MNTATKNAIAVALVLAAVLWVVPAVGPLLGSPVEAMILEETADRGKLDQAMADLVFGAYKVGVGAVDIDDAPEDFRAAAKGAELPVLVVRYTFGGVRVLPLTRANLDSVAGDR